MPYDDDDDWNDDFDDDASGDDAEDDTIPCPACGEPMYEDSPRCPQCGEYVTAPGSAGTGQPLWIVLTATLVLAAAIMFWVIPGWLF